MNKKLPKAKLPKPKHKTNTSVLSNLGNLAGDIFGEKPKTPKPKKKINQ